MKYRPELFRDDYNLEALQRIQPPGHPFELLVTPRFSSHYAEHRFEPLTAALIRTVCRRKKVFIDVGAHYGFFTVLAALENPELEVHALEPISENMDILSRNANLNDLSNIRCHEAAASDRVGKAPFVKSCAADNSAFRSHPDVPQLTEIEVETMVLSSLLEGHEDSPLLVKIDTDGHEIPVLEGLEAGLGEAQDVTLIVELNPVMQRQAGYEPEDLLQRLSDMGFAMFLLQEDECRLIPIDPSSDWSPLVGPTGYANLYCRPKSLVANFCFLSHSHALAGAERSLAELVEQLVQYHGAVCNVVIPGDGPLRAKIAAAGAGVILADYGWWCSSDHPSDDVIRERLGDDLARFLARTLPEVETVRPDLICTNSMVVPYGAILAAILHRPHIWNLHEYGGKQAGYQFYLPFEEILEVVRRFSDFIFGATRALPAALFPELGEGSYDFLYPHIRTPEQSMPTTVPQPFDAGARPFRLVELSSLTSSKQQELDLQALAEVRARGHQATLLLKGPQDPQYVGYLEELGRSLGIADEVKIEEYGEDVWSVLDAADAVVISAPTHTFGRVAAEGMLRGKPVVYPAGTDIAEYMDDGVTGLGYDIGDHQQMADQIERLIVDPNLAAKIGAAAYERATRLFTRDGFADKFIARARQILATGPANRPPLPKPLFESLLTGVRRLTRESRELRDQLLARSEELATATVLAATRDEEVGVLKPLLEARERELADGKSLLAAHQEELVAAKLELESVQPILDARELELTEFKQELAAVKLVIEAREAEIAAREREMAAVQSSVAARDEELGTIRGVLTARDEELAAIRPVLAAREEELAAIQPILAAREEELAAIHPVLAAREQELENFELLRQQQATEIQDLGNHLREAVTLLERLRNTILGRLALWIVRKR